MRKVLHDLTRIVQAVSLLDSPQEQVRTIVNSISETLRQEVCSLYRIDSDGKAELLASHGLITEEHATLPPGKGLVGLVVRNRHPVNLADAASHPDFYILQNSNEEQFKSFCGVPLVRSGQVIGVLVVQSRRMRQLGADSEAFLVTLASQLAMLVSEIPSPVQKLTARNRAIPGIVGAPGVAVGVSRLCVGAKLESVPNGTCEDIEGEIQSLHELLQEARTDIEAEKRILGERIPENVARIFDTYTMLLADKLLVANIETEIRTGHWLPGALRITFENLLETFRSLEDPYLRARHEDIEHLGDKLLQVWSGEIDHQASLFHDQGATILVGSQVSVSDIARVPRQQLAGIVCFEGSSLSHCAVLARALGVPAVMGVREIRELTPGEKLVVDGNAGQVIVHPTKALIAEYQQAVRKDLQHRRQLDSLRDQAAITRDGTRIMLMVNTGLLADISPGLNAGAEGVGLYRTEIPFMMHDSFPGEDEQMKFYAEVLNAYAGKPVYMRTLDIGGDKQLPYFPIHHEENPALGWRGIRLTLDVVQLMVSQVRAMMRAAASSANLYIILPMVSSLSEVARFNALLEELCSELDNEGLAYHRPPVGIMLEVPAAISQLKNFKPHIDFVSIGSNDLSQYLLALDRNNAKIANRYDHVHPAVLLEIDRILKIARRCRLPVSLCGEMAADPTAVALLVGMGVRQLSMSAALLPEIKHLIRLLEIDQARSLARQALKMADASQIRQRVEKKLVEIGYLPQARNPGLPAGRDLGSARLPSGADGPA